MRAAARALLRILRGERTPDHVGRSVAVGLFVGCLPLYGLHFPLCVLFCVPFGLDVLVAYLAANISNPLLAPFLLLAEVEIGTLLLDGRSAAFDLESARRTGISGFVKKAAVGSLVLGAALGLLGGALASRIAKASVRRGMRDPALGALDRTRARYTSASIADRSYVALKLSTDPVVSAIRELGQLGEVVDAGCGRGQLSLFLLELGHASRVSGFDFDARKVRVAQMAASGSAEFEVADLRSARLSLADTILLIDVLHYLETPDQDALLARAAAQLREGGRLLVREVDADHGRRGWLTRVLERIGTRLGYNRRAAALHFRPLSAIAERLQSSGLSCRALPYEGSLALANRLLIAERQASSNSLQNSSSLDASRRFER